MTRDDEFMLRAAQLQHAVVLTLNRLEPELNSKAVARNLGTISYQQLRKIIGGQAHMSFRDLVMLSDQFGPLLVLSEEMRSHVGALPNGWLFPTRADDAL